MDDRVDLLERATPTIRKSVICISGARIFQLTDFFHRWVEMLCTLSIRDTSSRAISKAGPKKTWGRYRISLETRNSHSYGLPSRVSSRSN